MSDEGYPRQFHAPNCGEAIPSQHVIESSMSAAAKQRVDRATENLSGKHCLIENTDESNAVEFAHCLPRSTKHGLLDSLEFAWNLPRFTLNVDTRANVIRLNSKLHRLFDSSHWLLLPETSIINTYNNARFGEAEFPIINQPVYRYTLVAHPDMLLVPIHRQNSLPIQGTPPADFTLHSHPYHDFPTIVSHVHPRFVLCNSGAKVLQHHRVWTNQGVRKQDVKKVGDIWFHWSLVVDQTGPEEQAFLNIPPNDRPDIADNDSAHTGSHRAVLRKRKLREQQGSPTPTPKGSKRQRLVDDGTWIDDGTLREFDRQTSMLIGEMKSKNQLILDWLNGVSTTGVKENLETNNNTLDMTMAIEGAL